MSDNIFVNPNDEQVRDINETHIRLTSLTPFSGAALDKAIEDFANLTREEQAMSIVRDFAMKHLDPSDFVAPGMQFDVYVVQFSYILGNWRAMVSTTLPDGMYYEVVFSKLRGAARLNAYRRFDHAEVPVSVIPGPALEDKGRSLVADYVISNQTYEVDRSRLGVNVVWFTYILGSWKALIETSIVDGMLYEVTFDPRKRVAYLDPYRLHKDKEIAIPASKGQ